MCHQVPRRQTWDRRISSDTIYAWKEALQNALEVHAMGGEVFAMPEAFKFIKRFVADDDMAHTTLHITTNGSVLHKHLDMLKAKDKIIMGISIDSIGKGYEKLRVGGDWAVVEKNILAVKKLTVEEKPNWQILASSAFTKTSVENIVEYANWHAENQIQIFFYDFINYRGTEDSFYRENVIENPRLLDSIPNWEERLAEATGIFKAAGLSHAAASLSTQITKVKQKLADMQATQSFIPRHDHNIFYKNIF